METEKILEYELSNNAQFLKKTNRGGNKIYKFSASQCPNLMQEVGRLREISFKNVGGGTGKPMDIDQYDTFFDQLIIYNPNEKKIIGGYRIQKMRILDFENSPLYHFFHLSDDFVSNYATNTVELGRSFIIPEYQKSRKGIFSLDNLFDAIAAWISRDQSIKYLVGKITIYPYDIFGNKKDLSVLYEAIGKHFYSDIPLIKPRKLFEIDRNINNPSGLLSENLKKDINLLIRKYHAPQLLSVYAGLSPSMKIFGGVFHKEFGGAEEFAMMIKIDDIYPDIRERYGL